MSKLPSRAADLRFAIWRRDGFRCTYCGLSAITDPITLEVDHIVSRSDGGRATWENLTTACRPCNEKKADTRGEFAGATQPPAPTPYSLSWWRAERGISIGKLARRSGLSRVTVQSALRGGRITAETTVKIARVLGVTVAEIDPEAARLLDGVA